ncbi:Pancreatic trypsin inhibitor Kunitz domain, partial [Trinorchestia longiramus]
VEVCELPVRPGDCVGGETRWYYSSPAQACQPFLYTGCGGNANNFPTKHHCEAAC